MLRWLWKMQSDRGGQHAEAGVLMATLLLLGAAVTVGSVPQLSSAVADQWVCNISDRGSEACGGTTTKGAAPGRSLQEVETFGASTGGAPAEPALSHWPRVDYGSGDGGDWTVPGRGTVTMDSCSTTQRNCIGERGRYHECTISSTSGPQGLPVTQRTCTSAITSATPLSCVGEGTSPRYDTCIGPEGVILHCTIADTSGSRFCTDTFHDADAQMPGRVPVSCGAPRGSSATCMGSNGTLYQCPTVEDTGECPEGGRNIDPADSSLTDCESLTPQGGEPGQGVRCTYTPASCNPPPSDGSGCASEAVSVRCLVDGADSTGGVEYQHCHSLEEIVPAGAVLQTECVYAQRSCAETVSTEVSSAPEGLLTTQVGENTLGVDPGSVVTLGDGTSYDQTELTALCESNPARCENILQNTLDKSTEALTDYFTELGVCSTDCGAFIDQLSATGNPDLSALPGRKLQQDRFANGLNVATAFFFVGSAATGMVDRFTEYKPLGYASGALGVASASLFVIGAIRQDIRAGDASSLRAGGAAATAVAIAAAAHLRTGTASTVAAARAGGATLAQWAGAGAGAVGQGAAWAQGAILAHAARIREAMSARPDAVAGDNKV